jgi:hypothetical protein
MFFEVHDRKRYFAHGVYPSQILVEFYPVKKAGMAVKQHDIAEVEIPMAFANESEAGSGKDQLPEPGLLLLGPVMQGLQDCPLGFMVEVSRNGSEVGFYEGLRPISALADKSFGL